MATCTCSGSSGVDDSGVRNSGAGGSVAGSCGQYKGTIIVTATKCHVELHDILHTTEERMYVLRTFLDILDILLYISFICECECKLCVMNVFHNKPFSALCICIL